MRRFVLASVSALFLATSALAAEPPAHDSEAGKPTVCSDEDRKTAIRWGYYDPVDAYEFGLKIQQYVEREDIQSLFELVDGELSHGPRKELIQGKSFYQVFSKLWKYQVLSMKPHCGPVGWRGFMLGVGNIWFNPLKSGGWTIFSINGSKIAEPLESSELAWKHGDKILMPECFTTEWISSDNFEEYYDRFLERNDIEMSDFRKNTGRYFGTHIPLEPIMASWGKELSLAVKLSECHQHEEQTELKFTDDWVVKAINRDNCGQTTSMAHRCVDFRFRVLRRISLNHCGLFVPYYAENCIDLRLVQLSEEVAGSMGSIEDVGIYGIIVDPTNQETYVLPLVNFYSANDAMNYVDKLDQ